MLKASALYMVIIIALVIGIICSSLVVTAYFYRLQYQKAFRYDKLEHNLSSGINIMLATDDSSFSKKRVISLFGNGDDSVKLQKKPWGIYDLGVVESFINKDSLLAIFSIGYKIDSSKWLAIYLSDQDRPLSLSGSTMIRGNAFIPTSGVKPVYMNNDYYAGDKRFIIGSINNSNRDLPTLEQCRLNLLKTSHDRSNSRIDTTLLNKDSLKFSFLSDTHTYYFGKNIETLQHIRLDGNITLISDTTIIIDSTAILHDVLIFAKSIHIKNGFRGNCQFFASDSISLGERCNLDYPSCLGILNFTVGVIQHQSSIQIGEKDILKGIIFSYLKDKTVISPAINIEKGVKIYGQIYSQGDLQLKDTVCIYGGAFTKHFIYRSSFSAYDDYLVNAKIDTKSLSHYYLTSNLMPGASKHREILQWLNIK